MNLQTKRLVELFLTQLSVQFTSVQERLAFQHPPLTVWIETSENEVFLTQFLLSEQLQLLPLLIERASSPRNRMFMMQVGVANKKLFSRVRLDIRDPVSLWGKAYCHQRNVLMNVSGIKDETSNSMAL